jgi:O-antigen/teichoic acid export membrane protein
LSFVRQFIIYGVGGAATRLAAIVLVPLYTRTLSVPEYGRLEVLLAIHALTLLVAGMQLESSVARDFYVARESGEAAKLGWCTVWLTAAGAAGVAALLVLAWALGWIPGLLGVRTLALLALLIFPAQLLGVQLVMLRFKGRSIAFTLTSFCDPAISTACSIWFIIYLHAGIDGALAGLLMGKTVCALVAWPATFGKPVRVRLRGELARRLLAYGVPSMPAVLIGWVQNAGSRLLLAAVLTWSDVAIGGIAIKVAVMYSFVVYSFRLAWEPFSISKLENMGSDPTVFRRVLDWYAVGMFLLAGGAALLSPQIVSILAPAAYAQSGTIAVLFLMGQFWVGMTNILVIGIHGARRTSLLLPVYGYGALLNVVILFALAQVAGVAAAGFGFLAGAVLSALLAQHYSNKHFNTGFTVRMMSWTVMVSLAFAALWYALCLHSDALVGSLQHRWVVPAVGLCLLSSALFIIARKAVEPGRGAAMWEEALAYIRGSGAGG